MEFPSPLAFSSMLSEQSSDGVVVWAPAKVNLYLEVLAKRSDGYHEIATLMVAVNLYDTLEFKEDTSGAIQLHCDHPDLTPGPDNLVWRAATLLQQRTGCHRGAQIRLVKRIPLAAGLAGGSTDAAATLAGLNRLWQLGHTPAQLAALGAELGSDVAFFFDATPAAWCTGRGEHVTPWALGRALWLVLACPPVGLSTADVYRGVTVPDQPLTGVEIRQAAADGNVEELGRRLHNRLQPVAERLCPTIARYRARLEQLHPAGQLMSGSGSSLFALCRDHRQAQRIARELRTGPEEDSSDPQVEDGSKPKRWKLFIVRSCS
jgi:4-diphosphocytidyl-2-C-methyl-D-erythritol kinase